MLLLAGYGTAAFKCLLSSVFTLTGQGSAENSVLNKNVGSRDDALLRPKGGSQPGVGGMEYQSPVFAGPSRGLGHVAGQINRAVDE